MQDTICAVATKVGGALAIVRLSGSASIARVQSLFRGKPLALQASHTLHFGRIMDADQVLDEVVVSVFHEGTSFTGEEMVEISCHASVYIVERLLVLLVEKGCRMAQAGEFSQRAFLNRKIDLIQAEAIADMIATQTKEQHTLAMHHLRGGLQRRLQSLRQDLIQLASLLELEIDFSEEDVTFADRSQLLHIVDTACTEIKKMVDSFQKGNAIKKGISVAIVGKPNAGKSSLFNLLLQEEKAIVTDIPGTTRDYLEDTLYIRGILFRIIDTAGLRSSSDKIEQIGIERAMQIMEKADQVIYMVDINTTTKQEWDQLRDTWKDNNSRVMWVANKIDQLHGNNPSLQVEKDVIRISVRQREGIEHLLDMLTAPYQLQEMDIPYVVANVRHHALLCAVYDELDCIKKGIEQRTHTNDKLALHIRYALQSIGELTGTIYTDEILSTIFSSFCIGK